MATRKTQCQNEAIQKIASASRVAKKAVADAKKLLEQNAKHAPALTKEEIQDLIQNTVTQTLSSLGIHTRTDGDIDDFRKDMEYMHAWRLSIQRAGKVGLISTITVACGGMLSMLWLGFKAMTGHLP